MLNNNPRNPDLKQCTFDSQCDPDYHMPCQYDWETQQYGLGKCIDGKSEKPRKMKCTAEFGTFNAYCMGGFEGDMCVLDIDCYSGRCNPNGYRCAPPSELNHSCSDVKYFRDSENKCRQVDSKHKPDDPSAGPYFSDSNCALKCNPLSFMQDVEQVLKYL